MGILFQKLIVLDRCHGGRSCKTNVLIKFVRYKLYIALFLNKTLFFKCNTNIQQIQNQRLSYNKENIQHSKYLFNDNPYLQISFQ